MRTCVGCRCRRPIGALARVARDAGGSLVVGRGLPGRGAWLCLDSPACVDRAIRSKAFDRAFRGGVDWDRVDRELLVDGTSRVEGAAQLPSRTGPRKDRLPDVRG